jgi:hypothetical protein
VAVHGAAASENGAKKSRIEANGNETQGDDRQEDKTHTADSGGEKIEPKCEGAFVK